MLLVAALLLGFVMTLGVVVISVAVRTYTRLRGPRIVSCPATGGQVAVEIDTRKAAMASISGDARLQLRNCSLWPERRDCEQMCCREVEGNPLATLVWSHFQRWYAGESCALCGKPFEKVSSRFHRPALMGPDRLTHEWDEVPAKDVAEALTSSKRICWSCHIRETFLRLYPDIKRYAEASLRRPHV